ncbi:hypothetical protein DAD186_00840 [Dermabacter vaginalis]|uniref:WXG100 family type VII secretion target n=1 Tax=Dermabacter vaginalis TaxID=1630135 RepID=A0A1B0ZFD4_9MICO|nr:DUF6507 family protein [Dermabacter vaginalis]ANP26643.1 hypothetical protein DAD186_00840 [Dermabacter vaginalis]
MHYDIDPEASGHIIESAVSIVEDLSIAVDETNSAISTTGSALQHSPASQPAMMSFLQDIVMISVKSSQGQAFNTINCTIDALTSYLEGDATMSSNASSADASIGATDMPGVSTNGS